MGDKQQPAVTHGVDDLIVQVKRMLEREAYHYCGDCRTHCRQTILTVEALKESEQSRFALHAAAEDMRDAIEAQAARRALASGLSVSEWRAFLWPEAITALAKAEG